MHKILSTCFLFRKKCEAHLRIQLDELLYNGLSTMGNTMKISRE